MEGSYKIFYEEDGSAVDPLEFALDQLDVASYCLERMRCQSRYSRVRLVKVTSTDQWRTKETERVA